MTAGPRRRVVVFAPHPDDESLGAAGLMATLRARGEDVHVVLMTCGDGFRQDAERYYLSLEVSAQEYLHLGYTRQAEALRALQRVAVAPDHVYFLGFPDGGLDRLFLSHWQGEPWVSPTTGQSAVPYLGLFTEGRPYLGETLLAAVMELLQQTAPDLVVIPNAWDHHPDHWATGAFVTLALATLAAKGEAWAKDCARWGYLIHWPAWPLPPAYRPGLLAVAPPALCGPGQAPWHQIPLAWPEVERKRDALMAHESQVELIKPFMLGFARASEVFQEEGDVVVRGPVEIVIPAVDRLARWLKRDNVLTRVEFSQTRDQSRLRLICDRRVSPEWSVRVNWHGAGGNNPVWDWWWSPNRESGEMTGEGKGREIFIHWPSHLMAGVRALMLSVHIFNGDRQIGRCPVRLLRWEA